MQKILILAALPNRLRLDKEIREIEEAIKLGVKRDSFEIKVRTAVRPADIRRAIAEERPSIVHFCGHGLEDGSLLLEDEAENHNPILPIGLVSLFKLHTDYVKCVLLNVCYSYKSAEAISQDISYVIGINQPIGDQAAIEFAKGFYDGLGYDNVNNQTVIQRAFNEGIVALRLENFLQDAEIYLWENGVLYPERTEKAPLRRNRNSFKFIKKKTNKATYFDFVKFLIKPATAALVITSGGVLLYNNNSSVCREHKVPDGSYFYAGSTTWTLFRAQVEQNIQKDCPKFKLTFHLHPPGENASTFGIRRLSQGQIDFAISSRDITDKEEKFQLRTIEVAIDGTAVAVNHSLNLPKTGLTIKQLRGIFTGEIQNWKQLGVLEDLPIKIYETKDSSYSYLVKRELFNGLDSSYNSIKVLSITDGVKKVKNDKGGIYLSSAAHLVSQCGVKTLPLGYEDTKLFSPYKLPSVLPNECTESHKNTPNILAFRTGDYPLTNRLFVIIKSDNKRSQESGKAFADLLLSPKYQGIIDKAGFVKIQQ